MGMLFRYHNQNKIDDKGVTKEQVVAPSPKVGKKPEKDVVDLNAMTGAKLRKFAKENGIENPEDYTIGELREVLREKLG